MKDAARLQCVKTMSGKAQRRGALKRLGKDVVRTTYGYGIAYHRNGFSQLLATAESVRCTAIPTERGSLNPHKIELSALFAKIFSHNLLSGKIRDAHFATWIKNPIFAYMLTE